MLESRFHAVVRPPADDVAPVGGSESNAQFDKSEFGRGLKNADCADHVSVREVKLHRA